MATQRTFDLALLVERAQRGDRAAFEQLVTRVQDMALALCLGRLGNRELARDAAQDAFADAFVHLGQLTEPAAFLTWFRRVLLKHCDRSVRRKHVAPAQLGQHQDQTYAPAAHDAERALLVRERERWLWDAVETLPDHERTVVALHYVAELSLEQIAGVLELKENAVKQRLHSARARVRTRSLSVMSEQLSQWKASHDDTFSNHVTFFMAIRSGDEARVCALLARDPSLLEASERWDPAAWPDRDLPVAARATPLIRAAERGNVGVLRVLLDAGARVDGGCGCNVRETPLWAAVVTGQLETARELLARGATADARAQSSIACLQVAAMRGDRALVELLLAHGADRAARDHEGRSAADWARLKGHDALLPLLGVRVSPAQAEPAAERPATPAPGEAPSLYATGIKALDLFAPLQAGDFVLVNGGAGVGRNIFIAELAEVARRRGDTRSVWVMWQRELWSDAELDGLLNETHLRDHVQVLREPAGSDAHIAREQPARALAMAERLLSEGAHHVQLTFFERPGVRTALEALRPAIGRRADGRALSAFVVPPWQLSDGQPSGCKPPFDAYVGFDPELARAFCFPALHAQTTSTRRLNSATPLDAHAALATRARTLLAQLSGPSSGDTVVAERARRLQAYLTQPLMVAEPFIGRLGASVTLPELFADVSAILDGALDHVEPASLRLLGSLAAAPATGAHEHTADPNAR